MPPTTKKRKATENAALPNTVGEVSANWKALLKDIPSKKAKKNDADEIWFDDVDPIFLDKPEGDDDNGETTQTELKLVKTNSFAGPTKAIAMDCEMVGVGLFGRDSILARVSIVNQFGHCLYDKYVSPTEPVTDYRTAVSGIRPKDMEKGEDFKVVQQEVSELMKGRILVGHALRNDMKVLYLDHPRSHIRDTSKYKPFRKLFSGGTPSLKRLAEKLLGIKVQEGEHDSVQDAQVAMRLYTLRKREWENQLKDLLQQRNKAATKDATK